MNKNIIRKISKELNTDYCVYNPFEEQSKKIGSLLLSEFKKLAKEVGGELTFYTKGYGFFSCFMRKHDKFIYFSVEDYREGAISVMNNILYRSASYCRDYKGGPNMYTNVTNITSDVTRLFEQL